MLLRHFVREFLEEGILCGHGASQIIHQVGGKCQTRPKQIIIRWGIIMLGEGEIQNSLKPDRVRNTGIKI
jgi:hypothetical protein